MDRAKTKLGFLFTLSMILLVSVLVLALSSVLAIGQNIKPVKIFPTDSQVRVPQQAVDSAQAGRVLAPTTSKIDRFVFMLKGCEILHELNDATALQCPEGVKIAGAVPDRLNHIHDLIADQQINADDVWNLGYDGTGVKVAFLDSGVDGSHIELSDSIVATKNFIKGSGQDTDGHGTMTSGVVTANGVFQMTNDFGYPSPNYATGVAPGADIIVGKVCYDFGCYDSDIMAGIEWAVAQGADVMSISIGGGNFGGHCDEDLLAAKVNWAVSQGVLATVSSGNDGAGVSSPACASNAIAVGAVDFSNVRPSWSNFGSALDVVAYGVGILSSYSCKAAGSCGFYWYAWGSGTSFSNPMVAGVAALILDKNPNLTPAEVKNIIEGNAVDLGAAGRDDYYGWGLVDALAAIQNTPNGTQSVCGNSIVEAGEVCDSNSQSCTINGYSGNQDCNNQCDGWLTCTTTEFCGDSIINGNEECDDGNTISGDGCSSTCQIEGGDVCVPLDKGLCNCNGRCGGKETHATCPLDCPV